MEDTNPRVLSGEAKNNTRHGRNAVNTLPLCSLYLCCGFCFFFFSCSLAEIEQRWAQEQSTLKTKLVMQDDHDVSVFSKTDEGRAMKEERWRSDPVACNL